jgi:pyruvate kinase
MDRRTKIVITIGPASGDENTIEQLLQAGGNVMRLNFSHGTHAEHSARIARIRRASQKLGAPVTLLQDLQGPKIRTGKIAGDQAVLTPGASLTLTSREVTGNEQIIPVDFPDLAKCLAPGNRILLDDGNLELVVVSLSDEEVETQVVIGGILKPNKGVNLPHANLTIQALTEKDIEDLEFGLSKGVDAVALSFVRKAADIRLLRNKIAQLSPDHHDMPIIAKLERPEALENLHEIVDAADGVMVARGDLGVEMSPEAVPIAQKQIIAAANQHAKVVITATQMLESMINNPRPTRAEASDVANAIFDGTDAVMLSGETAIGKYPVKVVETMAAIVQQAESHLAEWGHWAGDLGDDASGMLTMGEVTHDDALSTTRAARELAHDRNVNAIAVFTMTGRTAQLVSKTRPRVPILAFTSAEDTYRRMPMLWGVIPSLVPHVETLEDMLVSVEKEILERGTVQPGQQVVVVCGFPVGAKCPPNLALLHTVGKWTHP